MFFDPRLSCIRFFSLDVRLIGSPSTTLRAAFPAVKPCHRPRELWAVASTFKSGYRRSGSMLLRLGQPGSKLLPL